MNVIIDNELSPQQESVTIWWKYPNYQKKLNIRVKTEIKNEVNQWKAAN